MINYKFPYIQNSDVFTYEHIYRVISKSHFTIFFLNLERNIFLEGNSETVCCDVSDDDISHKRGGFFNRYL